MKLPLTDKFLWDIYLLLEEADEAFRVFAGPKTWRDVFYPDLARLRREYEKKKGRKRMQNLISYLKKKGYIKIKNLEKKEGVLITRKGAERILKINLKICPRKRRNDGKWIMVIFDIPEEKRLLREIFRERLQTIGYQKLQKSIWVSPFDVFEETERIIRKYGIDTYVRIFLIEEIEL